ncbi:TonB-dependent receptor plug domain-containing protein [Novosphingobium sp. FSY-8]|uniref:TonB-dependent receptor plug domain-containing protein n=1 Tax=Novosphingobium ovatum TaxID=1908523 RepID=A0ABW9X9B9_9SPHN|nr:TonB-dependent receptor [Novosphingobium ovatum]NBC35109.1 TonB-dependent receptor plug domain-containing protein [Novosphingobium ovatum]
MTRSILIAACSVLALAVATPAMADEITPAVPAAMGGDGLETIVVTAQKRRENLQTTPISISVLTATALEQRHVTSLVDLGDGAIPSLKVAPFYSRNSALIVNIRGVGVLGDSNQPARDQGVGVYVDGVYMGRAQGLGTALYDIENVEVLKGPQGTLFGRNTEGGAVNITTRRPTGQFHLSTTVGYGNFGAYKGELHLDLPEYHGVALKIDAVAAHRDPMVLNPLNGAAGFNQYDKRGAHIEALWHAAPNFTADYAMDVSYDASTSLYLQLVAPGSLRQAAAGTIQTERARVANVGVAQQPSIGKTFGQRLTLDWQVAQNLTLKSITAYRDLTQSQFDNGSAASGMSNATGVFTGVAFARNSLAAFRQNQVSQEFQAIGEIPQLKFVGGAMWYQERVQDNAQAYNTNAFTDAAGSAYVVNNIDPATQRIDRASHVVTTSAGLYGQATFTPAYFHDQLHLTGGLRWTRDMKHGQLFIVNGATPVAFGVTGPRNLDAAWSRIDPMVNLAYDLTRDNHVYVKWSTGYRSGGANSRSLTYSAFNPESVSIFEIGTKNEFWNRRARLNLSVYAGAYKNIQVDFFGLYETFVGGVLTRSTRTTTETINAPGTGALRGAEAEFAINPVDGLTLGLSYAYTYVRIPSTVNPFPNSSGVYNTNPVPIYQAYTPRHSASGTIDYEAQMSGYKLRLHLDGNFDSGFYGNNYDPVYYAPGDARNVYQPKGDKAFVVNGRLAFADIGLGRSDARLTAALWVRNMFNEQHLFYKSLSATSGTSGFFNDPRTFGGEINIKF